MIPTIRPAFEGESVNVFFATDENYAPILATALASLIRQASPLRRYDVMVLFTGLGTGDIAKISSLAQGLEHVSVRLLDVRAWVEEVEKKVGALDVSILPEAACYRLFAPSLFPAHDRVVYLDCDLILEDDVAELFETDLKGKALGAVRAYPCLPYLLRQPHGWWRASLGIKEPRDYFCSGTLIMDLARMRRESIEEKILQCLAAGKKLHSFDQDIMNQAMEGDVEILDPAWMGFGWQESLGRGLLPGDLPDDLWLEYRRSVDSPKIIHYVWAIKPWDRPDLPLADKFWNCAISTPYFGSLASRVIQKVCADSETLRNRLWPILLPWTCFRLLFHAVAARISSGQAWGEHIRKAQAAKMEYVQLSLRRHRLVPMGLECFVRNLLHL